VSYLKRSNNLLVVLLLLCSMTAVATANEIEIGDDHYLIFYHNDALGSPLAVELVLLNNLRIHLMCT